MGPELDILRDVSQVLSSSLDLKRVFDRAMRVLAGRLGIERARLVIVDEITGGLRVEAAYGLTPEEQRRGVYAVGEGVTGRVFATGEARVVPDVRCEPDFLDRTAGLRARPEPYSLICVPIISENQTIGVLSVDKPFVDNASLEDDRRLLTIVTDMVSQAVRINAMASRKKEELLQDLALPGEQEPDLCRFPGIVGSSPAMMEVFSTVDRVAATRATVLLLGETGTGKEMIAKAIHHGSNRRNEPFIRFNCGALSGQLLESELFGHVKGAFTGAVRDKVGRFEAAQGGTLFLDEIGTLEMQLQVKLLRVLQEREFERVGDYRTREVDVRIIAAANRNLADEVKANRFREDLYYRLNVVAIRVPPLRERRGDIPKLMNHFLDKYNAQNERSLRLISRDLLNVLLRYPWPGNVRELENTIERAVVLSQNEHFTEDLLPPPVRSFVARGHPKTAEDSPEELMARIVVQAIEEQGLGLGQDSIWSRVTADMERALISAALKRCDGVKIKAADFLGINRNTLNKKYQELGLAPPGDATKENTDKP